MTSLRQMLKMGGKGGMWVCGLNWRARFVSEAKEERSGHSFTILRNYCILKFLPRGNGSF